MSQENLNAIIGIVLIPLAGALIPLAITFLNQKTQEIKDRRKDAKLNKYIDIANNAVTTAVNSVYQTIVSKYKGTNGWTEEIQKEAFTEAKLKAVAIMGTAARQALQELGTDFDIWLENKIEATIAQDKVKI
jgi:hypothetical protein